MNLQQRLIMAKYIASSAGSAFEWGYNDCNTFIAGMVDRCFGKKTLEKIQYQYSNLPGAIKFSKKYMTAAQWLYLQGYREVEPSEQDKVSVSELIEGDIVAVDLGRYTHVSVFHNNALHTIDEQLGYTATSTEDVGELNYKVWRHN
jgi:hypothetical protein